MLLEDTAKHACTLGTVLIQILDMATLRVEL